MDTLTPPTDTIRGRAATAAPPPAATHSRGRGETGATRPTVAATARKHWPAQQNTPSAGHDAHRRHGPHSLHLADDGIVDPLAVELRAAGYPVRCTTPELAAAARHLHAAGVGITDIARRLRINGTRARMYAESAAHDFGPSAAAGALAQAHAFAELLAELDRERRIVNNNARREYWRHYRREYRRRNAAGNV